MSWASQHRAVEGRHRRRVRFRRPARLLAGAVAVMVAAAPVAGPALKTVVAQADAYNPQPGMPTARFPWKGIAGREMMRRVIRDLTPAEPDQGTYSYVHLQRWPADPALGTPATAAEDIQVWRAGDGSGTRSSTIVSADSPGVPAIPQPSAPAVAFASGGLPLTLGIAGAKAEILAGQFDHYGRQLRLRLPEMVAIMNMQTCLTSQQRAAALQVLADTEGLMYLGRADDYAGRPGIIFSLTGTDAHGATVRDILTFDEATGALLSYEQQFAEVFTKSQVRPAAVMSYVLYLRCGRTEYQGQLP